MHKLDVNHRNKLDSLEWREFLPPYEILKKLGLKEGDVVANIGCGIGYFSIPAADIVGSKGIVYAMDVELETVEETQRRAAENGMTNIRPIVTAEYDMKVGDSTVSFAFACLVLHEVEDRVRFIREIKRILKGNGKIVIVEWIKKESDWGLHVGQKLEISYVTQILQDCGFKSVSTTDINEYFYAVVARK
ncbi:MAG: methyltransferase domain-containing protein [Firmicutes bacterium]|nr:methyltransferase domain-containing protein [Bacillota bacterium]